MRTLLALLLMLIAVPAAAEPVRVTVTRQGDHFIADYTFPTDADAWGFWRSSLSMADELPFRPRTWSVLTPDVKLERRGKQDALVARAGKTVPRRVKVRLTPFTGHLIADYVPAMQLGGKSLALFDGHFSVFSVGDRSVLDTLQPAFDPAQAPIGDPGTAIEFKGRGLRIAGDVDGYRLGQSNGAYGLFDVPQAIVRDGVATVIDTELPQWISEYLAEYTPQAMASLTAALGPSGVTEPTVLAAWEGVETKDPSMNGGTLKGLILMRFEGADALQPNDGLRRLARWFVAHEAAHFWLGQSVAYETVRDSWIMEGGADLLAIRTLAKLDSSYDAKRRLNRSISDCVKLGGRPVSTAHERNEHDAFYACGAVFGLVAERANRGDFFGFARQLIADNQRDKRLNRAEWLGRLDQLSGRPTLRKQIETMLDDGTADPAASIAMLLKDANIPFSLDPKGTPQLQ